MKRKLPVNPTRRIPFEEIDTRSAIYLNAPQYGVMFQLRYTGEQNKCYTISNAAVFPRGYLNYNEQTIHQLRVESRGDQYYHDYYILISEDDLKSEEAFRAIMEDYGVKFYITDTSKLREQLLSESHAIGLLF